MPQALARDGISPAEGSMEDAFAVFAHPQAAAAAAAVALTCLLLALSLELTVLLLTLKTSPGRPTLPAETQEPMESYDWLYE
jgi:hypothetical protein